MDKNEIFLISRYLDIKSNYVVLVLSCDTIQIVYNVSLILECEDPLWCVVKGHFGGWKEWKSI